MIDIPMSVYTEENIDAFITLFRAKQYVAPEEGMDKILLFHYYRARDKRIDINLRKESRSIFGTPVEELPITNLEYCNAHYKPFYTEAVEKQIKKYTIVLLLFKDLNLRAQWTGKIAKKLDKIDHVKTDLRRHVLATDTGEKVYFLDAELPVQEDLFRMFVLEKVCFRYVI